MSDGIKVKFDAVRELAFGSILATYAAVGAVTDDNARLVRFVNDTDVDCYASIDGATNHIRMKANSFFLVDFTANKTNWAPLFLEKGITFSVKRVAGAPSSGTFFIEVMSAAGGR